jgi:hypothetical protein
MNDAEAFEHYKDPANLTPSGPAKRLTRKALDTHVPVRFAAETIDAVRSIAERDGLTVSSWIRRLVTEEVQRRQVPSSEPRVVLRANVDVGSSSASAGNDAPEKVPA